MGTPLRNRNTCLRFLLYPSLKPHVAGDCSVAVLSRAHKDGT